MTHTISTSTKILAAGFAALGISGCSEPITVETVLRPVKSMVVQDGGALRERSFSGTARSAGETELSFKVSGTVAQVNANVGDTLTAGQLFATLDAETYRVELEQARADAASANAQRRSAEAEYQRVRQLYANDNASRNELDNALAETESAQAGHDAAVQAAKLASLNLGYTQLSVQRDCTIADVAIEENENIAANQRVATASCGQGWEVIIDVPESVIARFSNGMRGDIRFPSVPGTAFEGIVTEVGIGTSDQSTFPVTLALSQTPVSVRTNLAAEVAFAFADASANGIYVPSSAVSQDQSGTFTYVIVASDSEGARQLEKRAVDVGELTANGLQVLEGLTPGERILIAGHINARDGLLVRAE